MSEVKSEAHEIDLQDEPLELRKRGLLAFPYVFAGYGLLLGQLSGAIAGTGVYPLFGTVYGWVYGGVAGLLIAIPLGVIVALAVAKDQYSARRALFVSTVISVIGASLGGAALCLFFLWMALPAVLPAAVAAGYAAKATLTNVVIQSQKARFREGDFGNGIKFWYLFPVSVAAPLVFWLAVWLTD